MIKLQAMIIAFFVIFQLSSINSFPDTEPNNTLNQANDLQLNQSENGSLSDETDLDIVDLYKLEIPENGILQVGIVPTSTLQVRTVLMDEDGEKQISLNDGTNPGATSGFVVNNIRNGNYYISIQTINGSGEYSITVNYAATSDIDIEPNDNPANAQYIDVNGEIQGNIGYYGNAFTDITDIFHFEITMEGTNEITVFPDGTLRSRLELIDSNGSKLLTSVDNNGVGGSEKIVVSNLEVGVYFIAVRRTEGYGSYTLTNKYTPITLLNDTEPNSSFMSAIPINLADANGTGQTYSTEVYGHLGYYKNGFNDRLDVYQIQIPHYGDLQIDIEALEGNEVRIDFYLYDAQQRYLSSSSQSASFTLKPGLYYIYFEHNANFGTYTASINFTATDEPDTFNLPTSELLFDTQVNTTLSEAEPLKYLQLNLAQDGAITLTSKLAPTLWGRIYLLSTDGKTQLGSVEHYYTTDELTIHIPNLMAGTYLVKPQWIGGQGSSSIQTSYDPILSIDTEPNDSRTDLTVSSIQEAHVGHIGYQNNEGWIDRVDYYRFDIPTDGEFRVICQADATVWARFKLFSYLPNGQTDLVSNQEVYYTEVSRLLEKANALRGSYLLKVEHISQYGSYKLVPEFITNQSENPEPNDTTYEAVFLDLGTGITGHLGFDQLNHIDHYDWYKVTLPTDGKLEIHTNSDSSLWYRLRLYHQDAFNQINLAEGYYTTDPRSISKPDLRAGDYFICMERVVGYGTYSLYTTYQEQQHLDIKANDIPTQSMTVQENQPIIGSLGYHSLYHTDSTDWYRINVTTEGQYKLRVENESTLWSRYELLPANALNRISQIERYYTSIPADNTISLSPGVYYLRCNLIAGFGAYIASIDSLDEPVSGTLTGNIKGTNGLPLFEINCVIQGQTITSDFAGNFSFDTLMPGLYTISCGSGSKYYPFTQEVEVKRGETVHLEITMYESNKTAPEDVAYLFANAQDNYMHLFWSPSVSPDVIDGGGYKLYINDASPIDLGNLLMYRSGGFENGQHYTCRLTVYDKFGNESEGKIIVVTPNGEGAIEYPTPTPVPGQPTATPTITPTPPSGVTPLPTNTPFTEPTSTPVPVTEPVPSFVYEFDQNTIAANGWSELPGGFLGAEPGAVFPRFSFASDQIPSSLDQTGIAIVVQQKQVTFLLTETAIETNGLPVLMRLTLRANDTGASVVLGALKGNVFTGENLDGSIGMDQKTNTDALVDHETRMCMIYQPDTGTLIHPLIQVAANDQNSVNVLIDKLEIYLMEDGYSFPSHMFHNRQ